MQKNSLIVLIADGVSKTGFIVVDHSKRFTIGFAAADLGRPFACFEPSLWHSIKVDLDRALAMTRQEVSLLDQVEKALTNLLSEGLSLLGDVAARLGIGPRTLRRRLQAQGFNMRRCVIRCG